MARLGAATMGAWLGLGLAGCQDPTADPTMEGSSGVSTPASTSDAGSSSDGGPSLPVSLIRMEHWELTAAEDDPFPDERPSSSPCELGWDIETGLLEVDTELCLYGSFTQTTLAEIHQGDTLEVVVLHDALFAEEPAVAHLAIAFGGEIAWQTELPIPREAAQVRESWTAPADVQINSPVTFHVHNHGTNNYRFVDLTVTSP